MSASPSMTGVAVRNLQVLHLSLQPGLHARPDFAESKASGYTVLTNHFNVQIGQNRQLYEYTVSGYDANMPRTKRKALFDKMVAQSSLLNSPQNDFATNRDNLIVAWRDISLPNGHPAQLDEEIVTQTVKSYERGKTDATNLTMRVEFNRIIQLKQLQNLCAGQSNRYPELEADLTALNLLLSKAREQGAAAETH